MTQKLSPSRDKELALIGVTEVEWWPTVRATVEGAHKLTEAVVTVAYRDLEHERESGSDIPPLFVKQVDPDTGEPTEKVNQEYEAVLRVRAVTYLQSMKLESEASMLELLADIFDRQLYLYLGWDSLAQLLRSMAEGKSDSYQSIVERLVTVVLPFLQVEELVPISEMMSLITDGGFLARYRPGKGIPPAKATLRHTNPGWELLITMNDAQKGVILNALGRRIDYE
jgi:hypothetical protein